MLGGKTHGQQQRRTRRERARGGVTAAAAAADTEAAASAGSAASGAAAAAAQGAVPNAAQQQPATSKPQWLRTLRGMLKQYGDAKERGNNRGREAALRGYLDLGASYPHKKPKGTGAKTQDEGPEDSDEGVGAGVTARERRNLVRAYDLASRGEVGRAIKALGSAGIRELTPAVQDKLRSLFPPEVDQNDNSASDNSSEDGAGAAADGGGLVGGNGGNGGNAGNNNDDSINNSSNAGASDAAGASGDDEESTFSTTAGAVWRALMQRPRRGGAGRSGITYDLLRALGPDAGELLLPLVEDIANGTVTPRMREWLSEARGIALTKPPPPGSNEEGVRPVAILETVVRLASGMLVAANADRIRKVIGPHDRSFRCPGGAEGLGHGLRAYAERYTTHAIIAADVHNGFNSMLRGGPNGMLETARRKLPFLWGYVEMMYGAHSNVVFEDRITGAQLTVVMQRGALQGDAVSSVLFCAVVAPLQDNVRALYPTVTLPSFVDDSWFLGPGPDASGAVIEYGTQLAKVGLRLAPTKCRGHAIDGTADLSPFTEWAGEGALAPDGIVVTGVPVGSLAFMKEHCERLADGIVATADTIARAATDDLHPVVLAADAPITQGLSMVARLCVSPQLQFITRATPPVVNRTATQRVDMATENLALSLIAVDRQLPAYDDENTLRRLHLPIRHGGSGVPGLERLAPVAYLSSVLLTAHVIQEIAGEGQYTEEAYTPYLPYFAETAKELIENEPTTGNLLFNFHAKPCFELNGSGEGPGSLAERKKIHHDVTEVLHAIDVAAVKERLLDNPKTVEGRRAVADFNSGANSRAGAFLTVSPTNPSGQMADSAYTAAAQLRLGVPLIAKEQPCNKCGASCDVHGQHAFTCSRMRGVNMRHAMLKGALMRIHGEARSSGLLSTEEGVLDDFGFKRKPGGKEAGVLHKADIVVERPLGAGTGRWPKIIDVTVRAPVGGRAHVTQGVTALAAEEEKRSFYNQRYVCHEGTTIPFAVETGGLLGGDAERWLRYIARAAAGPAKEHLSAKVRQYYERIAVAVQTGNAYVLRRWMSECVRRGSGRAGARNGGG